MNIYRYPEDLRALSSLNHMEDALDAIRFLCSEEFVRNKLCEVHKKTESDARLLSGKVVAHARVALDYASQTLYSPPHIAPLPGYYAVLNLAKVVTLFGPFSAELSRHSRWHGVTYNATGKLSQSLLTEEVKVRSGGALALFYKTLTGRGILKDRVFRLKGVYRLTPGISHEVGLATGASAKFLRVHFRASSGTNEITVRATVAEVPSRAAYTGTVRMLPVLNRRFRKVRHQNGVYQCTDTISSNKSIFESPDSTC